MAYLSRVTNRYTGRTYKNRLQVTLVGGPELSRALQRLDDEVRVKVAKEAVMAMGEPIAAAWQQKLPIGPEPYHLKDAITAKSGKTKYGASGSVAPRRVKGAEPNEQPGVYAAKLEYGSRYTSAQPSARPAFDQQKQNAVDAAENVLRAAAMRVAR